jgi:hypothetical protein
MLVSRTTRSRAFWSLSAAVGSLALLASAFVGTASAAIMPTVTGTDMAISLASPPSIVGRAAVDIFGPNGSYLHSPAQRQQALNAFASLPAAAQHAIVVDVLTVSSVSSYTTPESAVLPNANSCGYAILYNQSKDLLGWTLILWSVQVNGCSNGSTVSNDSYFPNIEELSWGWGFNTYANQHGSYLSSSDYEAFVNAIFTVGEYNFGISSSQSITVDAYGNGNDSGACTGGTNCYW